MMRVALEMGMVEVEVEVAGGVWQVGTLRNSL